MTERDALVELYEWAFRAIHQGTGRAWGEPEWHLYMTVWSEAEEMLPRIAALLGRELPPSDPYAARE